MRLSCISNELLFCLYSLLSLFSCIFFLLAPLSPPSPFLLACRGRMKLFMVFTPLSPLRFPDLPSFQNVALIFSKYGRTNSPIYPCPFFFSVPLAMYQPKSDKRAREEKSNHVDNGFNSNSKKTNLQCRRVALVLEKGRKKKSEGG